MKPQNSFDFFEPKEGLIAGVDEAGRGPLAGPVVAACVVLGEYQDISQLNDSKKLSESKRASLFDQITKEACAFGVGTVSPSLIDEMNILRASLFAMKVAFDDLLTKVKLPIATVLVDGNQRFPLDRSVRQVTVIGGDSLYPQIMAASILAKVTRDRIMAEMDLEYPGYGFGVNKGYGTQEHLDAIKKMGPSPIHRMSFAPLKKEPSRDEGRLF